MPRPRRLSDAVTAENVKSIAASLRKYGYRGPERPAEVARWLEAQGEDINTPVVSVETRVGRRQFIDPDRVERVAQDLRDRGGDRDARWLEQLAGFETFAEAEDHQVFVPVGVTTDDLCLTPRSRGPASAAFTAQKQVAAASDVILTNHALALTDCRYRGGILGTGDTVPTVVFDEADALPEVARSLADERIGLGLVADVVDAAGPKADAACRELKRLCAGETVRGDHRLLASCAGKSRILELVGEICDALETVDFPDDDAAEEGKLLRARLRYFRDCTESGGAVTAIAAGAVPSLAVVHREPVRILRHVFEKTQAAFFVSATLAAPAANPVPNDLLRAFGIAPGMKTPARINYAGWSDLQPGRYGRMGFRFADRSAPGPFRRNHDDDDRTVAARRKLAQGIGRGIRGPIESCTLWILDPRFPLPKSMAWAIGGPGQARAVNNLPFINCIPSRFRRGRSPAVDRGEVWPFEPRVG